MHTADEILRWLRMTDNVVPCERVRAGSRSRAGFFSTSRTRVGRPAPLSVLAKSPTSRLLKKPAIFGIVVDRARDQGGGEKLAVENDAQLVVDIGRLVGQVAAGQLAKRRPPCD